MADGPPQWTIGACKTITPKKSHIVECTYILMAA